MKISNLKRILYRAQIARIEKELEKIKADVAAGRRSKIATLPQLKRLTEEVETLRRKIGV